MVAAGGGELVRSGLKFAPFIAPHETVEAALSALDADQGT